MIKILILFSLFPIAGYWLVRVIFCDRVLAASGHLDCRITGQDYAKKLGYAGKLSRRLSEERKAAVLAEVSLLAAYELLRRDQKELVIWRQRVDWWGRLVVPFSLMIVIFGVIAGRPPVFCVASALAMNALVAMMKWSTRAVAKLAAELAIRRLNEARIPRKEDEAAVESCLRALAWK